jgi:hypothetical protein
MLREQPDVVEIEAMVVPAGVRVLIATQPVDFRNYAERRIMRSPGRSPGRRLGFPDAALRIIWRFNGRSASPGAASGLERVQGAAVAQDVGRHLLAADRRLDDGGGLGVPLRNKAVSERCSRTASQARIAAAVSRHKGSLGAASFAFRVA